MRKPRGATYSCTTIVGSDDFDARRGVGRTGTPVVVIHDFCKAPPKTVFSVALDELTPLSDTDEDSALSGGRRIIHKGLGCAHRLREGFCTTR